MSCPRCDETDFAAFAADPGAPEWSAMRDHYPRCGDCSAEVARWSRLTRALAESGPAANGAHPDEARLLAYESQRASLESAERQLIEAHLDGCARCRSELKVLEGFDFATLAPAAQSEAVGSPRQASGRIRDFLAALGERLFGGFAAPAWVAAALLTLALPAALLGWWITTRAAPDAPPPSIARVERPESPVDPSHGQPPERSTPVEELASSPAPEPAPPIAPEPPAAETPAGEPTRLAAQDAPAVPTPTPSPTQPTPPAPVQIAALLPSELPSYQPDLALAGGSLAPVRPTSLIRAAVPGAPQIFALGPDHVGATQQAGPVLYWYLSAESQVPVELSISSENGIEPLLELRVDAPVAAGVHALSLADHGVVLAPGITHHWYATLVRDPANRDADVVSGAALRRTPGGAALRARLESAGPAERAHVLAAFGYWYDAFDTLSAWIDQEPKAESLREHRAALLEQAGLAGVARADLRPRDERAAEAPDPLSSPR